MSSGEKRYFQSDILRGINIVKKPGNIGKYSLNIVVLKGYTSLYVFYDLI